jgi:hypothetical protein
MSGKMVNQKEKIVFYIGTKQETKLEIPIPSEIEVIFTAKGDNGKEIDQIVFNEYGNNSSLPRIYFKDSYQKRTIIYIFQMYRGKYHVRYQS